MRYYYFNPINKRNYFPAGFLKYSLFFTIYQPYKLTAKLLWFMWCNLFFFRWFFSTINPEKYLPLNKIKNFVSKDTLLAFNLGSQGVERKITVLGIDTVTNETVFFKYATTEITCNNVYNEGLVLQQLSKLSFVPQLLLMDRSEGDFTLIKTSVVSGLRMKYVALNHSLLSILFCLSEQNVVCLRVYKSELLTCFAHGDFCPWNMMNNHGEIRLFDWELAGMYTLGYDVFTYLFHYEFLIATKTRFDFVLKKNLDFITEYFLHFNVVDWRAYLYEFSNLRYSIELEKNDKKLTNPYHELRVYALSLQGKDFDKLFN